MISTSFAPIAEAAGDEAILGRAMIVRGDIEQREGHFAAAAAIFEPGDRARCGPAVTRPARPKPSGAWAWHCCSAVTPSAAEAPITEALRASRVLGLRRDEAWALQNLAWIAFMRGEVEVAEERLNESMVAFADASDYGGISWALGLLGWVRLQQGRLDEAEALAVQIIDELKGHGDRWASAMMTLLLASVRLWRGFTAEAARAGRGRHRTVRRTSGTRSARCRPWCPASRRSWPRDRSAEGLAALAEAEALAAAEGDPHITAILGSIQINVACQLGEPERARHLVPVGGLPLDSPEFAMSEVRTTVGLLALQQGDPDAAVAALEQDLAILPAGAPAAFANSTLALARAAAGQAEGAEAAAALVATDTRATYHDRAIAQMGRGFAALQLGDRVGGRSGVGRGRGPGRRDRRRTGPGAGPAGPGPSPQRRGGDRARPAPWPRPNSGWPHSGCLPQDGTPPFNWRPAAPSPVDC